MKKYLILATIVMAFYGCKERMKNEPAKEKVETKDGSTQTDDKETKDGSTQTDDKDTKDEGTNPIIFVSSLEVSATEVMLNPNETAKITVKVMPENADDKGYTMTSLDESVATVDAEGTITPAGKDGGVTTIKIVSNDGAVTEVVKVYVVTTFGEYTVDYKGDNEIKRLRDDAVPESGVIVLSDKITKLDRRSFTGLEKLKKIILPKTLTSIGAAAFRDCKALEEIVVPENVSVAASAFTGCTSLKKAVFGKGCTFNSFGLILQGCSALEELVLPEDLTSIPKSMLTGCTSLTELNIPNTVETIGDKALEELSSLKKVTILGESNNFKVVDNVLFTKNNEEIILYPAMKEGEEYTIPEGVTTIKSSAFNNSMKLTKVIVPASVTTLAQNSFYNIKTGNTLKTIEFNSTAVPTVRGEYGEQKLAFTGKILVKDTLVQSFKSSVGFNSDDITIEPKL